MERQLSFILLFDIAQNTEVQIDYMSRRTMNMDWCKVCIFLFLLTIPDVTYIGF